MMKQNTESLAIANSFREWSHTYLPKNREMSPNTQRAYNDALALYVLYLKEVNGVTPEKLGADCFSVSNINKWMVWLRESRKCSPSTCNHRLSCLKSFISYMSSRDYRFMSTEMDAKKVKQMKSPKMLPEEISQSAIASFFKCIDQTSQKGRRDYTLFYLMYSVAARIDEILSLKIKDLHLDENSDKCYMEIVGKGSKQRRPPILKDVKKVLTAYIKMFHGKEPNPNAFLFQSNRTKDSVGCKLTQSAIDKRIKQYALRAHAIDSSVPEKMHCHNLRHARASHWLEQGLDLVSIQRLMGHVDINTTSQYIFISTGQKQQVLEKLEDSITQKVGKKWKSSKVAKDLFDYLGMTSRS